MARQVGVTEPEIQRISAVTLATHDMERAVRFYKALGFTIRSGGPADSFTSFLPPMRRPS